VRLLPPDQGKVLDIACGRGGTTATLCEHLGNHRVEGIDRSMWNINMAMAKYPDVRFRMANPTRLDDEDESIAAILCFEGGLYLDSRRRFVKEAWRLLKPGGVLLMADRLANREALRIQPHIYRTNYVRDLASYRRIFESAGFSQIKTQDCGSSWLQRHADHASGYLRSHFRAGLIPEGQYSAALAMLSRLMLLTQTYVLVEAKKPGADHGTTSADE
jgi:SAM-dependent methyltransferase